MNLANVLPTMSIPGSRLELGAGDEARLLCLNGLSSGSPMLSFVGTLLIFGDI